MDTMINALKSLDLRAFLFDMDGVLYDSMPFHAKAWIYAFAQEGVTFDAYNVYMREGMTGSSTVQEVFQQQLNREATEEDCQRIYKIKADYFVSLGEAPEMKDVDSVLNTVLEYQLEPFLVTGSGQRTLIDKLNHSFPNVFKKENMVTAFDVKKGKPDPEPEKRAARRRNGRCAGADPRDREEIRNAGASAAPAPCGKGFHPLHPGGREDFFPPAFYFFK